jgi:hypothetical protein
MQKEQLQFSVMPAGCTLNMAVPATMPIAMESKSHRKQNGPAMQARFHGKVKK